MGLRVTQRKAWTKANAIEFPIHFVDNGNGPERVSEKDAQKRGAETVVWYLRPMLVRDRGALKGEDDLERTRQLVVLMTVDVDGLVDENGEPVKFTPAILEELPMWLLAAVSERIGEMSGAPDDEGE